LVVIFVVMIAAMYFLMIRPNRKAQQVQQQLLDSIQVGSRVMTGSGIFGTVRHLGDKQVVIEVSPGSDMTVLRQAIRSVVKPEDDEFEYSDEPDSVAEPDTAVGPGGDAPDMSAYEQDVTSPTTPAEPEPTAATDEPGSPEDHPDDSDQPTTADNK